MGDLKSVLERGLRGFEPSEDAFERTIRRRDRKRRNQRIAAGVVGIAVFVAAVWIVWDVASLDRSEPSVPAVSGTTGPAETGPVETAPTLAPDTRSNGIHSFRIPPEGTAISTPVEGELIVESKFGSSPYVRVYADGRVLSAESDGAIIFERRLSPEGVELVRSGAIRPARVPRAVPASAWLDAKSRPWVPARYGLCFRQVDIPLDVEAVSNRVPASAQALLRGSDPAGNRRCLVMTPEEARSLKEILSEALSSWGDPWGWEVGAWSPRDGNDAQFIRLRPFWPDGPMLARLPW